VVLGQEHQKGELVLLEKLLVRKHLKKLKKLIFIWHFKLVILFMLEKVGFE